MSLLRGDPIVDLNPSSTGQLPVPAALDARSPTLFENTIHDMAIKVNSKNLRNEKFPKSPKSKKKPSLLLAGREESNQILQ